VSDDTLVRLSDSDLALVDASTDVRGRRVVDADGDDVGEVDDLLVHEAERRVQLLCVRQGGFLGIGADRFLVPVDAVARVTGDAVHVDRGRAALTDVPGYDPEVEHDADYYQGVTTWWGTPSHVEPGYTHPVTFKDVPPYAPPE
jgi:sporulation protein YlmC with PRC-barrel domain